MRALVVPETNTEDREFRFEKELERDLDLWARGPAGEMSGRAALGIPRHVAIDYGHAVLVTVGLQVKVFRRGD